MIDISKAIELIEKHAHIGILLPPNPDLDALAAAEVLWAALEKREKILGLVSPIEPTARADMFEKISSGRRLPREFIISMNTDTSPVSQLRYEKAENKIDIIFSPKHGAIKKESVSYRDGRFLCDCAIAIGVPDAESLGSLEAGPDFLKETPVINIDISSANKNYGEANLLHPEKNSYSEIVYGLVSTLTREPLEKKHAAILLAALLHKTDHFRSPATTPDSLLVGSELMRLGAALPEAQSLIAGAKDVGLLQFLGRASVRSKLAENRGILWSFVTAEDFEKTGRTPKDLPRVLEHIEKEFPRHKLSALVWQNPEDNAIYATLSGNRAALETLEARGAGKFQSPYLLLSASFQSFREAEEILTSLFDNIL